MRGEGRRGDEMEKMSEKLLPVGPSAQSSYPIQYRGFRFDLLALQFTRAS